MGADWVEDKRYVIASIDELKADVKELKNNDGKFATTLAVLTTKMMLYGTIATTIVGTVVAFVMNTILGV